VPLEIELGVREVRLLARELSFGLRQLRLEGAGIDLGQEGAGANHLALGEVRLHQLTVDAALDRDGIQRSNRAERRQINVQVAGAYRRDDHRNRSRRLSGGTGNRGLGLDLGPGLATVSDPGAGDEEAAESHDDDEDSSPPATRTHCTFRNNLAFSLHADPLTSAGCSCLASSAYRGNRC